MRVFVAGASGAIGTRLVPQLIDRGHEVINVSGKRQTHQCARGGGNRARSARPAHGAESRARCRAWAIAHQATALANLSDFKHFDRTFAQTNRLPTRGPTTCSPPLPRRASAGSSARATRARATRGQAGQDRGRRARPELPGCGARELERNGVPRAGGHGGERDRTSLRRLLRGSDDKLVEAVRKRMFPIVGDGGGMSSFIHLDDAAGDGARSRARRPRDLQHRRRRARRCLRMASRVARIVGAKPPRRFRSGSRGFLREVMVMMGTESRGASNAKASAISDGCAIRAGAKASPSCTADRAEPLAGVAREVKEASRKSRRSEPARQTSPLQGLR